jgi:hypothetical protein
MAGKGRAGKSREGKGRARLVIRSIKSESVCEIRMRP